MVSALSSIAGTEFSAKGRKTNSVVAAVALAATLVSAPGAAEQRYSGQVLAVDAGAGVLAVEELSVAGAPARREFTLERATSFELIQRAAEPAAGDWPNGYTAAPLEANTVRPGDFVTVTAETRDGRLTARRVSVVRPMP